MNKVASLSFCFACVLLIAGCQITVKSDTPNTNPSSSPRSSSSSDHHSSQPASTSPADQTSTIDKQEPVQTSKKPKESRAVLTSSIKQLQKRGVSFTTSVTEKQLVRKNEGKEEWEQWSFKRKTNAISSPFAFHMKGSADYQVSTDYGNPGNKEQEETYYTGKQLYVNGSSGWYHLHTYDLAVEKMRYHLPHLFLQRLTHFSNLQLTHQGKIDVISVHTTTVPLAVTKEYQKWAGIKLNTRIINGEPFRYREATVVQFQAKVWIDHKTGKLIKLFQKIKVNIPKTGKPTQWIEEKVNLVVTAPYVKAIHVPASVESTAIDDYGH